MSELGPRPGAGHPDEELLSGYLDGSLDVVERNEIRDHLVGCASCRNQLEQLQIVRDVVRTLPFVDPPFGFYERTLRLGPRPSSTASQRFGFAVTAGILGLVAVLVTLAVVSWRADQVRPAVTSLANALSGLDEPPPGRDLPPDGLPATLGRFAYQGPVTVEGRRYEVYADAGQELGVTWWDAELRGAPRDAQPSETGSKVEGWTDESANAAIAVVQRGDRVYAVVGPKDEDMMALAAALPPADDSPSLGDRMKSAGGALLEAFGFGG